jgi:rare lipoprotein A (peptidoglycan hydrolase)
MIAHGLARRGIALGAIALLAGVLAFAAASRNDDDGNERKNVVKSVPVPGADWYRSLAAPYPATTKRERTSCGQRLGPKTLGVAHPVLPCGVKLFIAYRDQVVLTQVVDRGPSVPGREFDVTQALAAKLGLTGTQQVRWRYAR